MTGKLCTVRAPRLCGGFTLIELLCVLAIIAVLSSMLLPAIARAYTRIKSQADQFEAPEIAYLLTKSTQDYCFANPSFNFDGKSDLLGKCTLPPKCADWIKDPRTEFVPFNFRDLTNKIVLTVKVCRLKPVTYTFTKGALSIRPESR